MNKNSILVKLLREDDASVFRKVRLEALLHNPDAFTSSYDDEVSQTDEWFAKRIRSSDIFVVLFNEQLAGVAALTGLVSERRRHIAILWSVYVKEDMRGHGIGRILLNRTISHADTRYEQVQLTVTSGNTNACRLYENCGFMQYGLESRALKKSDGTYLDEILMVRFSNR